VNELDIAIVGMSALLPGAPDVAAFWKNLVEGKCSLEELSETELEQAGVDPTEFRRANYVRVGSRLQGIEYFDNEFFGISNRDARLIEPQHRLLLEFGWKAFEDAGYDISRYPGRVGVYVGVSLNTYLANVLLGSPDVDLGRDGQAVILGNAADYAATRLSYLFDLRGPSMTIQTACSTGLVTVHEACQGLLSFNADMALAGACSVTLPNPRGYLYQKDSLFSPDGRVRAFDARAAGTVFTNGLALVVLKRRADAERDGDFIHAIIKGSAINNDGADKVGYIAPSVGGQSRVIQDALTISGVPADAIEYVETHGTATELGDLVEMQALTEAYRTSTQAKQFCAIGSVKTNIGHTDVAAGAVGLIKTALALTHRVLPASLGFESPNPRLGLESGPFFVNAQTRAWETSRGKRRAAVSSFGIGGTNAHAVLEEAAEREPRPRLREAYSLTVSARSAESLHALVAAYAAFFAGGVQHDFADICYTSNVGRRAFKYRHVVLAEDLPSLCRNLEHTQISDEPARDCVLSVEVDADGAGEFVRALDGLVPGLLRLVADLDAKELAAVAAAQLVYLLYNAGIDARAAINLTSGAERYAQHGAPPEFQELLRQEPARFSAGPSAIPACRLIVKRDSVWLEQDEASPQFVAVHAEPTHLVPRVAAYAWRLGVAVDWAQFHSRERRWRVPLPTYAFARRRHWVEARGRGRIVEAAGKNPDIAQWFFRPIWRETAPPIRFDSGLESAPVLVVSHSAPSQAMLTALSGSRVIQVTLGTAFERVGEDRYRIAVDDERSYRKLADALSQTGAVPRYLLHMLLVDDAPWPADGSGFAQTQVLGLNSVVLLLRQLAMQFEDDHRLSVAVVASDCTGVFGGDRLNPDKATIVGATRTFPSENPAVDCRIVDVLPAELEGDARTVKLLISEFHAPAVPENEIIAIRGGRRWHQTFTRLQVPKFCASPVNASGTYVILGGLGELGLNLSGYLAERARCNLVLVGSSKFVARSEWDAWIATHGKEEVYSRKIAALRTIEKHGARVRIVQCDVSDRARLHETLDAVMADYGSVSAIIHAAGIVENSMIANKDMTRLSDVFRAKVRGTYHLLEYVANHPGPKVILCSSMNALVGGLGQIDNTCSNAFIDAVSLTRLAQEAGDVCSINWGAINSARLAEPVVLPQFADLSREHKRNHMSQAEIHQVYDRILSWSFGPRLVVSTIDLGVVLKRWGEVSRVTELARLRQVATAIGDSRRQDFSVREYRSSLHRFVVEAWCGILGIETLEWDDDLFSRGAHSLGAVQFSSMLMDSLGLRLHAMALYEFPRVGALVEYLQTLMEEKEAKAALKQIEPTMEAT
jgi:acyl transferase domain-containing protein/acyl carrier protein